MEVEVRPWEARDREPVRDLLRLLSRVAEVRAFDAPVYVAIAADGRVVGMVTLCVYTTLTGPKAYLDHLVVAPEWRRRGVARRLVEHTIRAAAGAGASRIDLTSSDEKAGARALYRSLGFHERDTTNFRLQL